MNLQNNVARIYLDSRRYRKAQRYGFAKVWQRLAEIRWRKLRELIETETRFYP